MSDDRRTDLTALERQLSEVRAGVRQSAGERLSQQEADDRSLITRVVLYVFGSSIGGVLLVILFGGTESASAASDLLKSVVLPVVTLVLGYYFGRSAKP